MTTRPTPATSSRSNGTCRGRLSLLRRTFTSSAPAGGRPPCATMRGGEGKRSMASLLDAADRVRRAEADRLDRRSEDAADRTRVLFRTIILGAVVSLSLMAFAPCSSIRRTATPAVGRPRKSTAGANGSRISALMGIADGVIATDDAGRVNLLNPVAQTLTGWSEADAVGRDIGDVFRVLDEETHERGRLPRRGGAGHGCDRSGCRRTRSWSRAPASSPRSTTGPRRSVTGSAELQPRDLVFQDVTGRREAEAALVRSRRFVESVLHSLPNQVAVLDEKGDIIAVNRAWISFAEENGLGDPRHGVRANYLAVCRGMMPEQARPQADGPAAVPIGEAIGEVIAGKRELFLARVLVPLGRGPALVPVAGDALRRGRHEGRHRLAREHHALGPGRAGGPPRQRVVAEARRRVADDQLDRLADERRPGHHRRGPPDYRHQRGRLVPDREGNREVHAISLSDHSRGPPARPRLRARTSTTSPLKTTGPSACRDPGRTGGDVRMADVAPDDGDLPMRGWLAAPFFGRRRQNLGVIQLSDKVEGEFNEEDEAVLVQLSQIASVAIENVRLADRLREADRQKDEFMAMMAHELRNPLGPVRNALEILPWARPTPGRWAGRGTPRRQTTHIGDMVNRPARHSPLSRGKVQLQLGPLDLVALVRTAAEDRRPALEAARIGLTLDLPPEAIWVRGDPTRSQVMGNLLHNAGKFTEPGGRVEVGVPQEGDAVSVSVRDTGAGMGPAMLEPVRPVQPGRTLLAQDPGRPRAGAGPRQGSSSNCTAAGSEASVPASAGARRSPSTCPATTPPRPRPRPAPPPATSAPHAHRILVVEDNPDAAESMRIMLELFGHEVRVADHRPRGRGGSAGIPARGGPVRPRTSEGPVRLRGGPHPAEDPSSRGATLVAVSGSTARRRTTARRVGVRLHQGAREPVDPAVLRELLEQV